MPLSKVSTVNLRFLPKLLNLLNATKFRNWNLILCARSASSFGRAHGMPKIHKTYTDIPLFRPIVDTTTTPHYNVGKFLSSLLNPLTINEYHLTDSFEAVSAIKAIPQNLFDEGFRFVSFDIESLFTNVPLKRTLNLVLKRVFTDGLIDTTLSKRTLKKLLLDDSDKVHFLDLEISQSGIDIYRKPTHTGQYTHFDSFEPWARKTAWIRSLFHRAVNICSNSAFLNQQILQISKFMAWNGFTAQIRSSIIRKLKLRFLDVPKQANDNDAFEDIRPKIWIRIPYLGRKGKFFVKKLVKKLQQNLTEPVKFVVLYQTQKISYFLPKKDKVPDLQRTNLIYEFTCPGCNESYIGKTERNLNTRLKEHFDPAKSAISKHLTDCDNANYLININNLYDNVFDIDSQTGDSPHYSFTNIIQNNTRILHSLKFSNSNLLLFLEAFKKPELNSGLKASKKLVVFP